MAKIIMFGNQKGGVGKSQCTLLVAAALSKAPFNLRVSVIDTDKQKSIVGQRRLDVLGYGAGEPIPFAVLDYSINDLQQNIAQLDKEYDIILFDTAGKLDTDADLDTQEVTKAMAYVDYLFLPFTAGMFTFGATLQFFRFAEKMQTERQASPRPLNVIGFVNLFKFRSRRHAYLLEDIGKLVKSANLNFMETRLGEFASFAEADTFQSFYAPLSSDPAKANFTSWLNEFCKTIKITN